MKGYFRKRGTKWSFSIDVGHDPETGKRNNHAETGFKLLRGGNEQCKKGAFVH